MTYLERLEKEVSGWTRVSVHAHRFGGKEFRFGNAEIGHLHTNGTVDLPFPRAVRDALLEEGQAEEHRWVPDSGWTTFHIRREADVNHALELLRLSYLRYAAKTEPDLVNFLKRESQGLHLGPRLTTLLEKFGARVS